ncbi:unnamed protein product [Ambrosiozyma monospora]|uniref:Unnamed protein product n=1 Tax=Ambrosiozyma monospora TaxID=43982 RepID=A0A9W6WI99_AMBMO|nr:unnamed protein product [Ambrosiozyma monospora]
MSYYYDSISWLLDPIMAHLHNLSLNHKTRTFAAGFGGMLVGLTTTLFRSQETIDERLIRGLIELDHYPTSHSSLAARYKEIMKLLGVLILGNAVILFVLVSLIGVVYLKVYLLAKVGAKEHLIGHERRLLELENLAEVMIEKQDEIFEEKYAELEEYFASKDGAFDQLFSLKVQSLEDVAKEFEVVCGEMRCSVVGVIERFHKDKLAIKRTVDDSLSKLKTYKLRCDSIDEKIVEFKNKFESRKKVSIWTTREI